MTLSWKQHHSTIWLCLSFNTWLLKCFKFQICIWCWNNFGVSFWTKFFELKAKPSSHLNLPVAWPLTKILKWPIMIAEWLCVHMNTEHLAWFLLFFFLQIDYLPSIVETHLKVLSTSFSRIMLSLNLLLLVAQEIKY